VKGKAKKLIKGEKGQVLLTVLVVVLFSSLLFPPLLSYMSSGLRTEKEVFEDRMYLSYAADSGVEDGLWQVKNKHLPNLFPNEYTSQPYNQYAYYDYSHSYEWPYHLDDEYGANGIVNNNVVVVTFQNVWVPKDIPAPGPTEAEAIAAGRLVVYGSLSGTSATEYQIKLIYYYNDQYPGEPDYDQNGQNLKVQKIGIWLPPGFIYNNDLTGAPTSPSEVVSPYKGGTAVVWTFTTPPTLYSFPLGTTSINPIERTITFEFTGPTGRSPGTAISWMTTTGVSGISYSWDCSVKVHKIVSEATGEGGKEVTAEAYSATTDTLKRGAAICGDYCAIGGTLMTTTTDDLFRDMLFKDSSADVQDTDSEAPFYIPPDAHVDLAYLYWSGWLQNAIIWGDSCSDWTGWTHDNDWTISSGSFRGHNDNSGTAYVTKSSDLDLTPYVGQTVQVSWAQSKGGTLEGSGQYMDGLDYAFSKDGGNSWTTYTSFRGNSPSSTKTVDIPRGYLTSQFRIRFILIGCKESGEYVYVDNIIIALEGSVSLEDSRVNQVLFNGVEITAEPINIKTQPGTSAGSLNYRCKYDATALVLGMIEQGPLGSNGSGTYTVGHVLDWPGKYQMYNYETGEPEGTTDYPLGLPAYQIDGEWVDDTQWSYAAWSLVIVYSNPETQGHQLYLYDDFAYAASGDDLDFDGDGHDGGTIGGFIAPEAIRDEGHAARLTCFVAEGDDSYNGDFIALNAPQSYWSHPSNIPNSYKLWDGTSTGGNSQSSPNDVWNSHSDGLEQSGIDIDTFTVDYPTIPIGATWARVDMYTPMDCYNLVYIILSFRSDIIPASTVSYLLR
jgi:hypothetical protein